MNREGEEDIEEDLYVVVTNDLPLLRLDRETRHLHPRNDSIETGSGVQKKGVVVVCKSESNRQ